MTYRWKGHSKSDQNLYRSQEEMNAWKERCPIRHFRVHLMREGIASEEELDHIERGAARVIEDAVEFASQSAEPSPETIYEGVYA